jgi:hypothetical protein
MKEDELYEWEQRLINKLDHEMAGQGKVALGSCLISKGVKEQDDFLLYSYYILSPKANFSRRQRDLPETKRSSRD